MAVAIVNQRNESVRDPRQMTIKRHETCVTITKRRSNSDQFYQNSMSGQKSIHSCENKEIYLCPAPTTSADETGMTSTG